MKALVADDKPLDRQRLTRLLKKSGVEVVAEASDGPEAARLLRELDVDVAFLNVEMPTTDGLGVVRELGEDNVPPVVFVTNNPHYAVDAFGLHAVDFLLKPFDEARLEDTLSHLRKIEAAETDALPADWRSRLRALLDAPAADHQGGGTFTRRLLIKDEKVVRFLRVEDVESIEADGNYVYIQTEDERHLVRRPLRELEAQLDPAHFARIHRSAIVNLDAVTELVQWFSGGYLVRLRSGRELKLSRRFASQLFDRVGTSL